MHQNNARSAAVAAKPYKTLQGTTLHLTASTDQELIDLPILNKGVNYLASTPRKEEEVMSL